MNTEVLVAFNVLLEAMNCEKAQLADAVREATLNGRFTEAQRLLAKTERIERLMEQVRRLRETWERLDEAIKAEREDVEGKSMVRDDEDAPELAVVERFFSKGRRGRGPRGAVNRTPNRDYRVPILEALEQLGGRGGVQEVLEIVYERMKDRLTEDDLKPLPSGRQVRWANAAMWERLNMVKDGLLRNDSLVGIWEMTEAGRAYLQQARQQSKGKKDL